MRAVSGRDARVSDPDLRLLRAQVMTRVPEPADQSRIADLRDLTDDQRYAMLAWLARQHPEVFDSALAAVSA